jgi:hypothetical protein
MGKINVGRLILGGIVAGIISWMAFGLRGAGPMEWPCSAGLGSQPSRLSCST